VPSDDVQHELGEQAAAEWDRRVVGCVAKAIARADPATSLVQDLDASLHLRASVDWTGLPTRISGCLTRRRALELLDDSTIPGGVRMLQEEYLEWRVVRDGGHVRRMEITTELREYWCVLAAYEPARTLALVAELAGEDDVPPQAVYGDLDPYRRDVGPTERERAFQEQMLATASPAGPYNDGRRAICCMVQRSNSLEAVATLAAAASSPRFVRDVSDGHRRCLTCSEAIPLLADAALAGRASDPVVVERLGQLAFEGRRIAFEAPVGVFIQDVEHTRLVTPRGEDVPCEWFTFSRGSLGEDQPGYRRLTFEVPPEAGLAVDELIDVATETPLRYGAQLADLVRVALFFRVSKGAALRVPDSPVELRDPGQDAEQCRELRERYG
jgi:hypothetical protein